MRHVFLFLIVASLLFSCKKPSQDLSFYLPITSQAVIPAGAGINLPFNINTPEIESNSASAFSGNNTRANLVNSISLEEMSMEITSPNGEDFSFLNEITVYISAEGLPESEIASISEVNENDTLINLSTTGIQLKEYLVKDKYDMRIRTSTDEILASEHKLEIKSRFLVSATLAN